MRAQPSVYLPPCTKHSHSGCSQQRSGLSSSSSILQSTPLHPCPSTVHIQTDPRAETAETGTDPCQEVFLMLRGSWSKLRNFFDRGKGWNLFLKELCYTGKTDQFSKIKNTFWRQKYICCAKALPTPRVWFLCDIHEVLARGKTSTWAAISK